MRKQTQLYRIIAVLLCVVMLPVNAARADVATHAFRKSATLNTGISEQAIAAAMRDQVEQTSSLVSQAKGQVTALFALLKKQPGRVAARWRNLLESALTEEISGIGIAEGHARSGSRMAPARGGQSWRRLPQAWIKQVGRGVSATLKDQEWRAVAMRSQFDLTALFVGALVWGIVFSGKNVSHAFLIAAILSAVGILTVYNIVKTNQSRWELTSDEGSKVSFISHREWEKNSRLQEEQSRPGRLIVPAIYEQELVPDEAISAIMWLLDQPPEIKKRKLVIASWDALLIAAMARQLGFQDILVVPSWDETREDIESHMSQIREETPGAYGQMFQGVHLSSKKLRESLPALDKGLVVLADYDSEDPEFNNDGLLLGSEKIATWIWSRISVRKKSFLPLHDDAIEGYIKVFEDRMKRYNPLWQDNGYWRTWDRMKYMESFAVVYQHKSWEDEPGEGKVQTRDEEVRAEMIRIEANVSSTVADPIHDLFFRLWGQEQKDHEPDIPKGIRFYDLEKLDPYRKRGAIITENCRVRKNDLIEAESAIPNATAFLEEIGKRVIFTGAGQFSLVQLRQNEDRIIYAPGHSDCHVLMIRAEKNGRGYLGQAHLVPDLFSGSGYFKGDDVMLQLYAVLDYFLKSESGFENVQVMLAVEPEFGGLKVENKEDLEASIFEIRRANQWQDFGLRIEERKALWYYKETFLHSEQELYTEAAAINTKDFAAVAMCEEGEGPAGGLPVFLNVWNWADIPAGAGRKKADLEAMMPLPFAFSDMAGLSLQPHQSFKSMAFTALFLAFAFVAATWPEWRQLFSRRMWLQEAQGEGPSKTVSRYHRQGRWLRQALQGLASGHLSVEMTRKLNQVLKTLLDRFELKGMPLTQEKTQASWDRMILVAA